MRNKSLYIMMVLLLLASADVHAQRSKRKKAPAKTSKAKPTAKKKATTAPKRNTATLQRNAADGDTTLKGATIEIIQSYKPQIKMAEKPEHGVNLPPVDQTVPSFTYEVPQQTLSYNYTSFPLRPLALGTDSAAQLFHNYVKVGGGNMSTLMLDAGIGSFRGQNYETEFTVNHLSQKGDLTNQKVSLTNIGGDGTLHKNGHAWHGAANVSHNIYHYYGYDQGTYSYTEDAVKQSFTGVKLNADLKNEVERVEGLNYHPTIGLSLYNDRRDASERTFHLGIPVIYNLDTNLQLGVGLHATLTQFENILNEQGNSILQFTPLVRYRKGSFSGTAGLYPTLGKGGNSYLLPDIQAKFMIPGSQFGFVAGWQGMLRQNSYEQLSTRNPFMFNIYTVNQTAVHEVYGGIQGNIGNHISFSGKLSWWQYNNLPMYVNDTATDNKQFNIVYDKVNALSIQAAVRYEIGNTFSLGLSGTWQNFTSKTQRRVWHEPGVQLRADVQVKPLEELTVTGYFLMMDEIYAMEKGGRSTKLNATTDLGVSGEYQLIKRLSIFLQVNNLLNAKNERWLGYPAFGTNVFGGVRLKF